MRSQQEKGGKEERRHPNSLPAAADDLLTSKNSLRRLSLSSPKLSKPRRIKRAKVNSALARHSSMSSVLDKPPATTTEKKGRKGQRRSTFTEIPTETDMPGPEPDPMPLQEWWGNNGRDAVRKALTSCDRSLEHELNTTADLQAGECEGFYMGLNGNVNTDLRMGGHSPSPRNSPEPSPIQSPSPRPSPGLGLRLHGDRDAAAGMPETPLLKRAPGAPMGRRRSACPTSLGHNSNHFGVPSAAGHRANHNGTRRSSQPTLGSRARNAPETPNTNPFNTASPTTGKRYSKVNSPPRTSGRRMSGSIAAGTPASKLDGSRAITAQKTPPKSNGRRGSNTRCRTPGSADAGGDDKTFIRRPSEIDMIVPQASTPRQMTHSRLEQSLDAAAADPCTPVKSIITGGPNAMALSPISPMSPAAGDMSYSEQSFSRFEQDFQQMGVIGSGSFGTVYKVQRRLDGCVYAVKCNRRRFKGELDKQNALNEVFALAALSDEQDSRHIVRYHNAWIEDDRLYIQTELCDTSLEKQLANGLDLDFNGIYSFLRQMAQGLEILHNRSMVHLDLKPANIYVKGEYYKVGDFGLVHRSANGGKGAGDLMEGDCRYLSKELLNEDHSFLSKADIFSLGATLYEMLTRQPLPPNGPEWHALRDGDIPMPKEVPTELASLLQAMLHPEPTQRPGAKDMLRYHVLQSKLEQQLAAATARCLELEQELAWMREETKKTNISNTSMVEPIGIFKNLRLNAEAISVDEASASV